MTSLVDRMGLVCGTTRDIGRNYWNSITNTIRKKGVKRTLIKEWERFRDRMRVMRKRADLSLRNLLAHVADEEGQEDSTSRSHPERKSQRYRHWGLNRVSSSVDYLAKCRRQSSGEEEEGWEENTVQSSQADNLPEHFSAEELEHYLVRATQSTKLDIEFQSVPREDPSRTNTHATMPTNIKKNRYKNNIPYDATRVVLQGDRQQQSDYINASYIEGIEGPRVFIATQGPKETNDRTIDDFWRMVWQNKSNVIVMLGNLIEGGRGKVSQYWPNFGTKQKYGQIEVEKKSVKEGVNWIRRLLVVSQGNHSRDVVQYQYIMWPDHDVPDSPYGAVNMILDMMGWRWSGPPVIHCSAGLGRTGTFLLVLRLLEDLQYNGSFKPVDTLHSLRRCRANLLDNQGQYRFAHQVLLDLLYGKKTRFAVHKHLTSNFAMYKLSDQYKDLNRVPSSLTYTWARSHDADLNRNITVLPPDGRQILLSTSHSKQYLNAVRVRDSNLQDIFLITEHPMGHTVGRCWRLAYQTRALAWVLLHDHGDNHEDFPSVLPPYNCCELEGVTVQLTDKHEKKFFTERSITTASKGVDHKMKVIHFKNWSPTSDLPSPPKSLIFLILRLQELRHSSNNKVVMISCSDGFSASGVLVCLLRMAAEIYLTRTVDVYRTVQSMRFDRPQFITSQKQYVYLHEAALGYFTILQLKEQNKKKKEQLQQKEDSERDVSETGEDECNQAKERKEIETQ